jgi:hypothetical protein
MRIIQVWDVDGNHQGSCIVNDDDASMIAATLAESDTCCQFVVKNIIPDTAADLLAEMKRADAEAVHVSEVLGE